jgi:hypothetical protein
VQSFPLADDEIGYYLDKDERTTTPEALLRDVTRVLALGHWELKLEDQLPHMATDR